MNTTVLKGGAILAISICFRVLFGVKHDGGLRMNKM